jgi:hypothetical protein
MLRRMQDQCQNHKWRREHVISNTNTNVNSPNHRARKLCNPVIATHIHLSHTQTDICAHQMCNSFCQIAQAEMFCVMALSSSRLLCFAYPLYTEKSSEVVTPMQRERKVKNYIHTAVHEIARRRCGCDPSQATNIYFHSGCGGTVHRSLIILYGSKCILKAQQPNAFHSTCSAVDKFPRGPKEVFHKIGYVTRTFF